MRAWLDGATAMGERTAADGVGGAPPLSKGECLAAGDVGVASQHA